ncbi:carbonic anhydrase 1-like [Belonocnema kinseyi]|uniref:carbonic anhydrase 1-like n=1 Tax=Belonocnema kinseyi TaxID=2817044 RepID=UPI00143DA96D|nr:carbonic anhydrase 1-like [Belonocnema kinseyi]
MEMKIFFYRADLKSFEKAETQKGGLAAFSVGLKSGYGTPDHLFDNLERNLHKVQSINSSSEITPFRFASIFDYTSTFLSFYFYDGSLDYPPCSESVSWFIVDYVDAITDNLIRGFRNIKLAEGDVSNVRPPQALNKRQVKNVFVHDGKK